MNRFWYYSEVGGVQKSTFKVVDFYFLRKSLSPIFERAIIMWYLQILNKLGDIPRVFCLGSALYC